MMLFHQNRYHMCGLGLLLCVLFSCLGCDSSDCPTQSKACGIRPGRYQYSFYKSLENDPATFPDGTEVLTYTGTTQVDDTSDGFVFSGGDFNAWEIQATCIDEDSAFLEITLNNKCHEPYITTATATLKVLEDGSLSISPYYIHWTCGKEESYISKEWWELIPE